jgi:hypothetical protein
MEIAILYICTGSYDIFWDNFYDSSQRNFYPEHNKTYYVFTDSNEIMQTKYENVHTYWQAKSGWPYDTLLRFNYFCTIQDKLKKYDLCYFLNANTEIRKTVTEKLIPFPNNTEKMIFWCHSHHYDDYCGESFNPERNPISTAYVPEGSACRCYGGGFFGGTSEAFINMSKILRERISKDLSSGYIALWHDQSHIIRYGTEVPHIETPRYRIAVEERVEREKECLIVFLEKKKYGGSNRLRNIPWYKRVFDIPKYVYTQLLKITKGSFFEKVIRTIVKKVRKVLS